MTDPEQRAPALDIPSWYQKIRTFTQEQIRLDRVQHRPRSANWADAMQLIAEELTVQR